MSNNERFALAGSPPAPSTEPSATDGASTAQSGVRKTAYRFLTLALITVVLALSTGDRAALSVAGSDMAKELGISSVEMGYLFSAFSWAYVLFLIPSG